MKKTYVIGLDFGTDSARALLVDAVSGKELDTEVVLYPRWNQGLYSDFSIAQFRHHPQDYIEVLENKPAVCSKVLPQGLNISNGNVV